MDIGWSIFICGMKKPHDKERLHKMENFFPISEMKTQDFEWMRIRILGLEFHYVSTDDSKTFNKTIVEYPYVKLRINFNAYPLSVNNENDMKYFYKLNLLKTMQYKYIYIGHIENPMYIPLPTYPIFNPMINGYAMLISNESDWSIDFDYTNANRKLRNSFTSYFPIHTHNIDIDNIMG